MPKVSVCIPSYQLADFIGQAIESVRSQSFTDWELLIEDDGSTDSSLELIRKYAFEDSRIFYVSRQENVGANATTNNLVRRATGEYIALLAADDVWSDADKLKKQVEWLDAHPEDGIVFGLPEFIDARNRPLTNQPETLKNPPDQGREAWYLQFKSGNALFISTSLYRRSLHEELGYFEESLPILCDMEWYVRITEKHGIKVLQERLASIRCRDNMANLSAPRPDVLMQSAYDLEEVHRRHYQSQPAKRRIMIATPFYEVRGYAPYIHSLQYSCAALAVAGIDYTYVQLSGDSYIWRARNAIAQAFMDSDCTHLMFIDSDEGWDLEGFLRVIKADADIVGAAYPVKNNWEQYGVTIHTNSDLTPRVREDGLIHAEKVPTGFMKISRKVFEVLKDKYPDNWYWDMGGGNMRRIWNHFGHILENHIVYGEDISFGRRWLATGGEIFIEPRVKMSHLGVQEWKGEYHDFLCRQPGGSRAPALISQ